MKNTIRVRKNGSTRHSSRKAKICVSPAAQKELTLIITDEVTGEVQSKFEIPFSLYSVFLCRAANQGSTVGKCLEEALKKEIPNLVFDKNSSAQALISRADANEQESSIRSQIALRTRDALDVMGSVGKAAGALAMMDAEQIQKGSMDNGGWESLEAAGFSDGALELARYVVNEFHSQFSILKEEIEDDLNDLIQFRQPNREKKPIGWNLEDAVCSLRHLLLTQSLTLETRTGGIAFHTSMLVEKKLEAAFDNLRNAQKEMRDIFRSSASVISHGGAK